MTESKLVVSGPKGQVEIVIPAGARLELGNEQLAVKADNSRVLGMTRSIAANAVVGVSESWTRTLELTGTGFRAAVAGKTLQLALGFSHPVSVEAPDGIGFEVKENRITITGSDRAKVGQIAAKIRGLKPADPYKAKGFKYDDEVIIKKPGKAAKAGGAAGGAK